MFLVRHAHFLKVKMMEAVFASHCGFVRNTAIVHNQRGFDAMASCHSDSPGHASPKAQLQTLGGQIEAIMASINAVGWNHNQVPEAERLSREERELDAGAIACAGDGSHGSGLGGQIADITAALNEIGWNHNRVPPEERIPVHEPG